MSDKPQLFEVTFLNNQMNVVLDPCGAAVSLAAPSGSAAGSDFIRAAVEKATSAAVKRAGELLTIIHAAEQKEKELNAKRVELEREKTTAPASLFGVALDARLTALEGQVRAVENLRAVAIMERTSAHQELLRLRDAVLASAVAEVKKAVQDRRSAVKTLRRQAAAKLEEMIEKYLTPVLSLDSEEEALMDVKPVGEVKATLEKSVGEVFAAGGLAPAEPPRSYRESEEREEHIDERLYGPTPRPRNREVGWKYGVEREE